jgi:hypothetical protein
VFVFEGSFSGVVVSEISLGLDVVMAKTFLPLLVGAYIEYPQA